MASVMGRLPFEEHGAPGETAADADHKILVSKIDKAIKRGAIHKNSGARKKSRAARTRAKLSA